MNYGLADDHDDVQQQPQSPQPQPPSPVQNNARHNMANSLLTVLTSRKLLCTYLLINATYVIVSSIFLHIYWNNTCDKDLRSFIVAFVIYICLNVLVTVYRYSKNITNDILPFHKRLTLIVSALWYYKLIWMIWTSWTFYSSTDDCKEKSPELLNLGISLVSIQWIFAFLPCLLITLAILCYPCLVMLLTCLMPMLSENQGVDEKVIEKLEAKKCTKEESDYTCSISLVDFKIEDNQRVLPCKHEFHVSCVDPWLLINKTCPLCRHDVTQEPRQVADQVV